MVSSDETKAQESAVALGRGFTLDERLREVTRPWSANEADFRLQAQAYLAGEPVPRWESQAAAVDRFSRAARGIVVSHGTVMSLFVASVVGADPLRFWANLRMPDAWVLEEGRLMRLEGVDLAETELR